MTGLAPSRPLQTLQVGGPESLPVTGVCRTWEWYFTTSNMLIHRVPTCRGKVERFITVTWDWSVRDSHFLCICMYCAGNIWTSVLSLEYSVTPPWDSSTCPFSIRPSLSLLQSINLSTDDSGGSHSFLRILANTNSARFDTTPHPNILHQKYCSTSSRDRAGMT